MNHKVTLNLFDVHPYFKVNFTIYLDYIDKQDGTKFNFPVINKFMFDGNEYLKVTPRGYICIDITSKLDRGESYNRNRFFAMDSKSLFYFISALENLIRIFRDRNIHLYTIDGDTGELILNKELATTAWNEILYLISTSSETDYSYSLFDQMTLLLVAATKYGIKIDKM